MYEKGVVFSNFKFFEEVVFKGDILYIDSFFFFGMDIVKKFLYFFKENSFLICEIDVYGDFL